MKQRKAKKTIGGLLPNKSKLITDYFKRNYDRQVICDNFLEDNLAQPELNLSFGASPIKKSENEIILKNETITESQVASPTTPFDLVKVIELDLTFRRDNIISTPTPFFQKELKYGAQNQNGNQFNPLADEVADNQNGVSPVIGIQSVQMKMKALGSIQIDRDSLKGHPFTWKIKVSDPGPWNEDALINIKKEETHYLKNPTEIKLIPEEVPESRIRHSKSDKSNYQHVLRDKLQKNLFPNVSAKIPPTISKSEVFAIKDRKSIQNIANELLFSAKYQ